MQTQWRHAAFNEVRQNGLRPRGNATDLGGAPFLLPAKKGLQNPAIPYTIKRAVAGVGGETTLKLRIKMALTLTLLQD